MSKLSSSLQVRKIVGHSLGEVDHVHFTLKDVPVTGEVLELLCTLNERFGSERHIHRGKLVERVRDRIVVRALGRVHVGSPVSFLPAKEVGKAEWLPWQGLLTGLLNSVPSDGRAPRISP